MPENGQEIPSLTRELCQHAEEKFNEAPVNRITLDKAKEYSNNHSQWTSVKYHLNSAVCGSEMNWHREDSIVSKDQLSTTINFKAGNIQISRSSSTDPTVSLRVTIPFRSVAGMGVNKATDTVAGHLFLCPNVFRKTPEGQWLLDSHAASSNISKYSLQFVEEKYDMSDLEVHLNKDPSLRKALDTRILIDRSYVQTIESTLDEVPEKRLANFPYSPILNYAYSLL